jgi:hypothetical protein
MSRVSRAFHRALVPLAAYYSVTLAIPLANGASQSNAVFITHALVVLVIPPVIILLACAVHAAAHVLARAWRKGPVSEPAVPRASTSVRVVSRFRRILHLRE